MEARVERALMLEKMPSQWDFEFWKERYESAPDIASALGILGAASSLQDRPEDLIVYLIDIVDSERIPEERKRALGGKALQVLYRILQSYKSLHHNSADYIDIKVLEKVLWFARPKPDFQSLVNSLGGVSEESKYIRRYVRGICTRVWRGSMECASLTHKLQVLEIYYASDWLMEFVPRHDWMYAPDEWKHFETVLPRLEELVQMDFKQAKVKTIEESAFFGHRNAYVLILARTVLSAGRSFYERMELERLREKM